MPAAAATGYRLTEDQVLLRDTLHDLADEQIAPRAAEIDRTGEFPEDIRQLLARYDVLALPFPTEHGGVGADLLTQALAIEQIARACTTSSLILTVQGLGSLPIALGGSDEQKARFFPDLASGRKLIAFGLTEPEAGSDAGAARTRAVRDGDDYVIDGGKRFITNGSVADVITVFAVTDPEAKTSRRLSCFAVEVPTPGFSVVRLEHKLGIRGSPTAELAFDHVRVPATNRIGEEGDGWKLAMGTFDRSRPGIAAQAVGIAQGALDAAVAYARDRKQFGQRIGDFQMVQAMLADMDARTEGARQLTYKACAEVEAGAPDMSRWASIATFVAGDAAMSVTTDAVQVFGGYGYTDDFPVERMMRDAKITQLYEGTQQIQRLVIAGLSSDVADDGAGRARDRGVRIVVLSKPVPDPAAAAERLGPDDRLDRSAAPTVINGNDEYTLEAALQIADAHPGEVEITLVAMAPANGAETLRKGLAMGATRGLLVTDPALAGSDAWSTVRVLAAALKDVEYDLILAGFDTSDGVGGVVGAAIATLLKLPYLSSAAKIEPDAAAGTVRVRRISPTGFDVLEAPMPALIVGTQLLGTPRYPSLKGIMGARSKEVVQRSVADLGLSTDGPDAVGGAAARTTVTAKRTPPARGAARVVRGTPTEAAKEIADFLAERRLV